MMSSAQPPAKPSDPALPCADPQAASVDVVALRVLGQVFTCGQVEAAARWWDDVSPGGDAGRRIARLRRFAWRVLAYHGESGVAAESAESREQIRLRWLARAGLAPGQLESHLRRQGTSPDTFELWLRLEAAYEFAVAQVLTPGQRGKELLARRLPLTRLAVDSLVLPSLAAAREAVCCLREDGVPPAVVGADAGVAVRRWEGFLEDLPPDAQAALQVAVPGEVLEPRSVPGGYQVDRVATRAEPDLQDPQVLARIDERLLSGWFARWEADVHLEPGPRKGGV